MKKKLLGLLLATMLLLPLGAQASSLPYAFTTSSDLTNVPVGNVDLQEPGLSKSYGHNVLYGHDYENVVKVDIHNGGMVEGSGRTRNKHYYTKPDGIANDENYLAVFGQKSNGQGNAGTAAFTLSEGVTQFSFIWGTIDLYNTLTVTNGNGYTYDITGYDILSSFGGLSATLLSGTMTLYFTLTDLAGIKSIVMESCFDSFEVARISAVPVPAAFLLFGSALLGVGAYGRNKKAKA